MKEITNFTHSNPISGEDIEMLQNFVKKVNNDFGMSVFSLNIYDDDITLSIMGHNNPDVPEILHNEVRDSKMKEFVELEFPLEENWGDSRDYTFCRIIN